MRMLQKKFNYKLASNWLTVELFAVLNKQNKTINDSPVSSINLAKLINLIKDNTISGKIAKTVFRWLKQMGIQKKLL